MHGPEQTRTPWLKRFWAILLVLQSGLLIAALAEIIRATPDAYPNQQVRLALSSVAGICIALSFLVERTVLKYTALAGALAAIIVHAFLWN